MQTNGTRQIAILCDLEPALEQELQSVLADPAIQMESVPCRDSTCVPNQQADVVFCSFSGDLTALLDATRARHTPVIVVTRHPETREWLDAIEAGAFDYCSAPFEARQIQWILNSTRSHVLTAA